MPVDLGDGFHVREVDLDGAAVLHVGLLATRMTWLAVVVELDLPAPLALVLGVPPGREDPGLPARQDYQPSQVLLAGPAVLQPDAVALTDQDAHRTGLAALQAAAFGDDLAGLVADGHVKLGWGGMHQHPVAGCLGVDLATGKRQPGRADGGKPQIPLLEHPFPSSDEPAVGRLRSPSCPTVETPRSVARRMGNFSTAPDMVARRRTRPGRGCLTMSPPRCHDRDCVTPSWVLPSAGSPVTGYSVAESQQSRRPGGHGSARDEIL